MIENHLKKGKENYMNNMRDMLEGYRITLAEILYHFPDYPNVLQTFIWQDLDIAPRFPRLLKFLDYWEHHLDGKLHSVKISSEKLIKVTDLHHKKELWTLH
jgi:uncharacterized protein Usg